MNVRQNGDRQLLGSLREQAPQRLNVARAKQSEQLALKMELQTKTGKGNARVMGAGAEWGKRGKRKDKPRYEDEQRDMESCSECEGSHPERYPAEWPRSA